MDDRFFNAFLPPSVSICGRRLERFTLWHQLLLDAVRSPITMERGEITPPDLLAAVAIFRTSYRGRIKNSRLLDGVWLWAMCRWPDIFQRELRHLYAWMRVQTSHPRYFRTRPGDQTHTLNSGPQCLSYKAVLMSKGGFSEEEAWNMPLGQSMWEVAQIAAQESGDIHFLDDADLDDAPVDISAMDDEAALAMFRRDMPSEELAMATFEHWRTNIKR
jgi:hypothetical protein